MCCCYEEKESEMLGYGEGECVLLCVCARVDLSAVKLLLLLYAMFGVYLCCCIDSESNLQLQ